MNANLLFIQEFDDKAEQYKSYIHRFTLVRGRYIGTRNRIDHVMIITQRVFRSNGHTDISETTYIMGENMTMINADNVQW